MLFRFRLRWDYALIKIGFGNTFEYTSHISRRYKILKQKNLFLNNARALRDKLACS